MPAQQGGSKFGSKLKGLQKSFDQKKKETTTIDTGGGLPAGINGVAQLVAAKIDEYKDGANKGKLFLCIAGVVVAPKVFEKIPVAGKRVTRTLGLYAKGGQYPKTQDQAIDDALKLMRTLGIDTANLTLDDWEDALQALQDAAPFFAFRTWKSDEAKARVQYVIGKVLPDYTEEGQAATDGVEDNTGSDESQESSDDDTVDWEAVGTAADEGASDAQDQIKAACIELGMSEEDVDAVASWSEAAAIANNGEVPSSKEATEEEATWQPEKGDVYAYKPKGAKKAIDCEIVAVMKTTLNLKNLADGKTIYKAVPYTENPPTIAGQKVNV